MKDLFKNTSVVLFLNLLSNGLNYVFQTFAARVVDIGEFGTLNAIFSFIGIVAVPGTALTMIAARELAIINTNGDINGEKQYAFVHAVQKKVIFFSMAVIALGFLFAGLISSFLKIDRIDIVILTVSCAGLSFFHPFYSGCLSGMKKFILLGLYGLLIPIYKIIGLLVANMLDSEKRLTACLIAILLGSFITAFAGYCLTVTRTKKRNRDKPVSEYALNYEEWINIIFINICFTIFVNADILIVRRVETEVISGLYSSVMLFGRIIYYSSVSIGTVILPYAATIKKEDIRLLNRLLLFSGIMCAIGLGILWLMSDSLIKFVYGTEYIGAVRFIPQVCFVSFVVGILTILVNYVIGRKKVRYTRWILLGLVVAILFCFLFAKTANNALLAIGISGCIADILIYISYVFDSKRKCI